MEHRCKCGQTDTTKFYSHGRNQCQDCYIKKASDRQRICRQMDKDEKLARGKCVVCSLVVMPDTTHHFEWNHIDPTQKAHNISHIVTKVAIYREEVKKCELVCLFCHADITKKQNSDGTLRRKPRKIGI